MKPHVILTPEVIEALNAYAKAYAAYQKQPTPQNRTAAREAWQAAQVVVLRNIGGIE